MPDLEMNTSPHKTELLAELSAARRAWENLLSGIAPAHMTQPGVCGEWSLKDLIAHIAWFENEMAGLLQTRALAGSELWGLPPDERNTAIYAQNRLRSLDEVQAESRQTFEQLAGLIEALEEDDLLDAGRFADMPPDWQPYALLAENSFEHYRQHIPQVREWLIHHAK